MSTELRVQAVHEAGLRMRATNGPFTVTTDYPLTPADRAAGFKPMELLLASLAACAGSVVASLLARLHQPVAGVEVDARGERRDEHPTVFTTIALDFLGEGRRSGPVRRGTSDRARRSTVPRPGHAQAGYAGDDVLPDRAWRWAPDGRRPLKPGSGQRSALQCTANPI